MNGHKEGHGRQDGPGGGTAREVPTRLRQAGHRVGRLTPGPHNAITDVPGVLVGHTTLRDDAAGLYSGVTAIVPEGLGQWPTLPAALHVANGYGKFVGATQLAELGELETPVLLTSTLSAFRAADALLTWVLDRAETPPTSVNPVVGEINDSWLSARRPRPLTEAHVLAALDSAAAGPVTQGSVGGGTGACALGFKGGIGTASRLVGPINTATAERCSAEDGPAARPVTVGALVQANMGGELRVGERTVTPESAGVPRAGQRTETGSCVVVLALDIPCPPNQLTRIAARGALALGRVGANYSHGSGDYGLAFSATGSHAPRTLSPTELDAVFEGVRESVEEAVIDALLTAGTVRTPGGRAAHGLPLSAVIP
ncbi:MULTISPECIES: P1 family peptidase [unclassified Streptomyces]|uniref:P1 family peptidase n=1 Tax=unclassified Streptomyces TaxID=2593676 RepID=UPI000CD4A3D0|nr:MULTISPECIES: P1 family peptidase [unclassified Streptomyces]